MFKGFPYRLRPDSGAACEISLTMTVPLVVLNLTAGDSQSQFLRGVVRARVIFVNPQVVQCLDRVGKLCSGPWGSRQSSLLTVPMSVLAFCPPSPSLWHRIRPGLHIGPFSTLGCELLCFLFRTWYSQGLSSKHKETEVLEQLKHTVLNSLVAHSFSWSGVGLGG